MGVYTDLKKQLQKQSELKDLREDALNCIKIYEKLKEINNGSVWSSQLQILISTYFEGYPSTKRWYKPSKVGSVFLRGIKD